MNKAGVRNEKMTERSLCFNTILLAWNDFLGITQVLLLDLLLFVDFVEP